MALFARVSIFAVLAVVATVALGSGVSEGEYVVDERSAQTLDAIGPAPSIAAAAYVVFDIETGDVLYEQDADTVRAIASITKLFTAAAAYDMFDLEERATLTWADLTSHGRAGNLRVGETYSHRELLFPLLLSSSNNAALALSNRAVADGQDLTRAAEALARDQGHDDTIRLADTSGLSADNVGSAADIAHATRALYTSYPYIFTTTRLSSYLGPYHGWKNNSPFLPDSTYLGGKHGFTNTAGRTAVALFTENIHGTERAIGYVILGSNDLSHDMSRLRTHVRDSVEWR